MSLFGENDQRPSGSSLFDESSTSTRQTSSGTGGGLFANDAGAADDSWGMPTPKRQARANLVKTLLSTNEVPESYVDAFDGLLASGARVGGGNASGTGVKTLMDGTGLAVHDVDAVLRIVAPNGLSQTDGLGRNEFNVLLALVGLAQRGEDVSLDSVDEHRKKLPEPKLPPIAPPRPATPTPAPQEQPGPPRNPVTPAATRSVPSQNINATRTSWGDDPWASPAAARQNIISNAYESQPHTNGMREAANRTTSNFSTAAQDPSGTSAPSNDGSAFGGSEWTGGFGAPSGSNFSNVSIGAGFGEASGDGDDNQLSHQRTAGPRARSGVSHGQQEEILVTVLPDKEGTFMFQYRNYEVTSIRRNSKVLRRYSDFVWLLDCLHKKYPFRQLPLLPPKRVAINGNHIAADTLFIEKRRRGLARFANAVVRHPVLAQEQLVVMFLTVPTELSVWRQQASVTVQEEFIGKQLPPTLEDSLPSTLEELFDTVRSGIRKAAEQYIILCNIIERLVKRKEGLALEYNHFLTALQHANATSNDTYKADSNDVPLMMDGMNCTVRHMSTNQTLLQDEARAWNEGVLDDFKRQRDGLVSMRDMFDRRDRLAKDNIPALEKRIAGNENKLATLRSKPEHLRKAGEAEKLEDAITKDKQSIVAQHARGIFIKECIRDEINIFQSTIYHISRLHMDWSQELVKYSELYADNWRALSEEVESMPLGE